MTMTSISPELAQVALEKVEGSAFEEFAQAFLSVLEGRSFVPLGGTHDGGADGIYECGVDRTFYQFTREANHRDKVRRTVKRLREFGREPKTVYYLTSRLVPHIDKEEDLLSDELGVYVKIRDRKYILAHINSSIGTIAAYQNHLASYTEFLARLTRTEGKFSSPHIANPAAYVFLQHEVTNRLGDRKLVHSVTDSLILWALSDTDPDKGAFLQENEIAARIFATFPWAEKSIKGLIRPRLQAMRNKKINGREVRWYKKEDKYCLPFDTRQVISLENGSDEALQIQFHEELKVLASEIFDADEGNYQELADICVKVIHGVFEKQGLLFSHFITSVDDAQPPPVVADCIDEALEAARVPADQRVEYRDRLETLIRKVFYSGSPSQREYLANLSRTYVLLFTLQAEPRVVEFLSSMTGSFNLYVGSDVIVKALSERFLAPEDQVARNLLRMASAAGASMYLSQCVLEEVYTHIRATYFEFVNYFASVEPYVTREVARNSDRILIRAYFYAKFDGRIDGWKGYLSRFISYDKILKREGQEELRRYLVAEYGFTFVDNEELESVADPATVQSLAEALLKEDDKENEALAYNAALLVHGIYGIRRKRKETTGASEFGLKTWWMTNQTRVLRHTVDIVRRHHSQYIMRPEFLLNFFAISPTCDEVRSTFAGVFPSVFGIQLGHRMKDEVFHQIMATVRSWKDYEPGRIVALMSDLSDTLKTDRLRRYDRTMVDRWS